MSEIPVLSERYAENVERFDRALGVSVNYDMLKKVLRVGEDELTLYFIDGFVKDELMQKLMQHFIGVASLPRGGASPAQTFSRENVPHVETEVTGDPSLMIRMVLSGASLVLGSTFGAEGIIIDSRSYPARETDEPESDKVLRGAHDGFVETMVFNTALIRRRIRDTSLRTCHKTVGRSSQTDVVMLYMEGRADPGFVSYLSKKLDEADTDSLSMGYQSLCECLIRQRWYDPFPKIRVTERPDMAAAQLFEGGVIIICDNSPEAIVLPTSIFDFMQQTDDYYMPPFTGGYLRIVRHFTFLATMLLMPLWYLFVTHPDMVSPAFAFLIPEDPGSVPLIGQILLAEFMIDGLKLASLNTPNVLSSSLGAIAGLLLGELAVEVGLLSGQVVIIVAFVAITNFSQASVELGFAFKFMRLLLIAFSWLFGFYGFFTGFALVLVLVAMNRTVNGRRSYLYPLIPFNAKALGRLFFRRRKSGKND